MIKGLLARIWHKPGVVPATEPLDSIASQRLARGSSYIVKERKPEFSFEIFTSLVKGRCEECDKPEAFHCESIGCSGCTLSCPCKECIHSRPQGICISTRAPEELREQYLLQTTPIFWISNHGSESITPTGLEVMADVINRFLRRSRNPVILLDGVEYLIITNGFPPVLKFLRDIQEQVTLSHAIFILPVNPSALEDKELALLERDMKDLGPWDLML